MTVAIPTLAADDALAECLASLERQTFSDFEVIVIDNSGRGIVKPNRRVRVISNKRNLGFGAAVNQAIRASNAQYLAVLNDDTIADPNWLAGLMRAMEGSPDAGMCASQVRLAGDGRLDSAGMLLCRDGSSKQRGHLERPESYARAEEVLLPSCSAAFYRRAMLDEIGLFDESFFLYCEDTDLGLRARWAGWKCLYVPDAIVDHRYSHSAGRATPLKAYYVERNRHFLILKNFPLSAVALAPYYALQRYFWHFVFALRGQGKAADFRSGGNSLFRLPLYVLGAHVALLRRGPSLWTLRRKMKRRLTSSEFTKLMRRFEISPRQVAEL